MSVQSFKKVLFLFCRLMQSISLHKLLNLYFQFSDGLKQLHLKCLQQHGVSLCDCKYIFLDCRGSSLWVQLHFQRHTTSNPWIGRFLFFLWCAGGRFCTYSWIFALLKQDCGSLCPRIFSYARIPPETTRWTPVWPGKNGVWRQNPQIQDISAAC